jgi:endonuclease III
VAPSAPAENTDELKKQTRVIIRKLKQAYPDAKCSLNHSTPFELLVATILSAQCTDERVNIVTADLFRKYRKPEDYLKVSPRELEKDIQSTGFFRNKTKSIQGTSKMLTEKYGGKCHTRWKNSWNFRASHEKPQTWFWAMLSRSRPVSSSILTSRDCRIAWI